MSEVRMISPVVKNVPWQEKPAGLKGAPIWRYTENPIIGRNPVEGVARIFNSAVMPYGDEFIGVFRGEQTNGIPYIYLGHSKDAIHWEFESEKIPFKDENGNDFMPLYAYDPRLVKVEDTIILSGVRISTALPSVWLRLQILRHLQELRILLSHSTETRCYSLVRSTVSICCFPVRLIPVTHRLAISS